VPWRIVPPFPTPAPVLYSVHISIDPEQDQGRVLNNQIFSLRTKNRYRVGTALELQSIPLGVCTSGASIFKTFLNITWQKCCGSGSGIRDPVLF
jgi:hypothetical protein